MAAAAAKSRNPFPIIISVVVVVAVVAVAVLVYFMNRTASEPAQAPAAGVVNEETGAIAIGEGDQSVDEYIDFMCPHCGDAWDAYGDTTAELVEDGTITFNIHPISILDRSSQGTEYSTRAANSVYCVAEEDGDAAYSYVDLLFRNQPSQGSPGLDDDELIGYAEQVGAGGAADCITNREYGDFVAERTQEVPLAPGQTNVSTPTVVVNGEVVPPTMDPDVDIRANLN
ncbi:hypothetical protein GCM10010915_10270 [Microbacterium faecale]|uniref:Thioredoxin-like fold domain-containing protein n=1 Tax=Microbacterium faecale TaxID=1804630 RepID=A0A916Y5R6_9MICO|nr:thioredoxin domain-containing protein [Microbacterium faecale]GGD31879.1 hypothetical protein GCM10010915_10270 [Microbacterium faecale]